MYLLKSFVHKYIIALPIKAGPCYLLRNMKYLILILLVVFGCTEKEASNNVRVLKLDPSKTEHIFVKEFIKRVEFIRLDTAKYFGNIDKLIVTNNRIYVLDAYNSIALYVYNREGEFLYDIASYGRGPGEFMGPYDFTLSESESEITIYDARSQKLSFYNMQNGNFVEDKILKSHFRRFERIENDFIFYMDNRPGKDIDYNINIKNRELKIIASKIPILDKMRGVYFMLPVNFSKYNNSVFFTAHSDYNIYKYDAVNKNFSPYITVDFGDRSAPEEFYKKHRTTSDRQASLGDAAYFISNYFEADSFRFFLYWVNNTTYYYLESKLSNRVIHTTNDLLVDNMGVGPLIRWPSAIVENKLIWYQQPSELLKYISEKREVMSAEEWSQFETENGKLLNFAATLSENDNPYLIFMEIDF